MNFKELLLPLTLALLTSWAIQHFFFNKSTDDQQEQVKSGQSFVAPKTKQELKPINTEIDFIDNERVIPSQYAQVETKGAHLIFSTDGASLERLEFKKMSGCPGCPLSTITPPAQTEKETRCFLVALNQNTPYYYELAERVDNDASVVLTYKAALSNGTIQKKFTVYKETYKIDLELKIALKNAENMQIEPRIFFPSPVVKQLTDDVVSGIVANEKGSLEKKTLDSLSLGQGWFSPAVFGSDDRYFIHAMVDDAQNFVQRAYYKFTDKNKLISILEGTVVDQQAGEWKISFYFGPKEGQALAAVDPRLEQTLDYAGILAPISKFLLYVLKLLYSFFKNFGLAIIALTVLVKLVLLPFTYKAEESMQKRTEFDKKLRYIQQKYKNEPEILAREKAELIQKYGMPGLSGCLPLLLQFPIFIALSRVLSSAIELHQAQFAWIPDLSARDPYYILPLITAVSMMLQSLTMSGVDPKQRISAIVMGLVIGAVTVNLAAGLSLYICTFTVLGVVQTKILKMFKRS